MKIDYEHPRDIQVIKEFRSRIKGWRYEAWVELCRASVDLGEKIITLKCPRDALEALREEASLDYLDAVLEKMDFRLRLTALKKSVK